MSPRPVSSGEVIRLHQVLFAEYESQQIQPPLPEGYVAGLRAEYEAKLAASIPDPEARAARIDTEMVKEFYRWVHRHGNERSALCLSGGGIRSATFGLGIVQTLARRRLLGCFDFLSTVSGGGYLGSWLTAWIHRVGLDKVQEELSRRPDSPVSPEPEPVRHLRSYSRYMSPKPGFLSADTWTLIGIFLRNLLLNWLVLVPLIAAALMFPRLSTAVVLHIAALGSTAPELHDRIARWVLAAAVVLGSFVIAYIVASRPSLADADPPRSRLPRELRSQGWFVVLGLLPLWLLAVSVTAYWAWTDLFFNVFGFPVTPQEAFVLFGTSLGLGGYLISRIWVHAVAPVEGLMVTAVGALGGWFAWIATSLLFLEPDLRAIPHTEIYISAGAPLLLSMFLLAATLFVGLSSYFTSDADREWLARCGSWILILIVTRSVLSAIVLFAPVALVYYGPIWLSSLGGISGVATLLLGGGAKTQAVKKPGEKASAKSIVSNAVLALAAPLFSLFLLVLLSLGTSLLMALWLNQGREDVDRLGLAPLDLLEVIHKSPWWLVLLTAAGFVAVGVTMGYFININRFSLHAAYRDRLIRAYLGASRPRSERTPNPFTGFDQRDNIQMWQLRGNRPFPLLNLTLNLVGGKELAWQDRKAEPFSVSPLHAGSWCLGYRDAAQYAVNEHRDTALTLGTAAAVSGAAASPNMGYHSSPAVTFLLALFNVRLGWWLGNPGKPGGRPEDRTRTYDKPGPRFAPGPFFAEAFGLTDDCSPYVYLSDGGHFENLGLYEMVLRRCRYIVISDAGEDPGFSFEDLGNAISKIRVDLGVPIRFEKIPMRPRAPAASFDLADPPNPRFPYFAVGRIAYSCVDFLETPGDLGAEADGLLIYIKACLNGTEPVDVFHYAKSHPGFPHESTANQLYTESQFESYRELGANAAESLCANLGGGTTLAELFASLEAPPA
jgi:hypothetical protein